MIGEPIENVTLEIWANFHGVETAPMAMQEKDVVELHQPPLVLYGEPTTSLVVIGNVHRVQLYGGATGFAVSEEITNYSPGTHVLPITTDYWRLDPYSLHPSTPIKETVATYEFTYHVNYVPPLAPILPTP